jgi:DNA helicase-2/ATP-dependent DNA helicase PcrA
LAIHIQNWALGAFEGFEGEESITLDAVDLTTVHQAKGLEWPVVFVPCVSAKRFPSSKTGQAQTWHVPIDRFSRTRYEGSENDERRLFYVALTRARDWLSVSTHDTPNRQRVAPSAFIRHVAENDPSYAHVLDLPPRPGKRRDDEDILHITFSELADFRSCGLAYRLRNLIGFQPPLASELGYGRAVHHVLRSVAEFTRHQESPPLPGQLDRIFDRDFYLPAANKPAHRQMKKAARRLVDRYVSSYGEDLRRVWAVERPFELHLPTAVVSGRADVILEEQEGHVSSLAIVDYKTAADDIRLYDRQLQIYTDAGRREGLDVRAAYVHDLRAGDRRFVDVGSKQIKEAEAEVLSFVERLRARDFAPEPGAGCRRCDVRGMCSHAAA